MERVSPGLIRDAIVDFLLHFGDTVSLKEIEAVVVRTLGDVPRSSIRSYLNLSTPDVFERTERGHIVSQETRPGIIAALPAGQNMWKDARGSFMRMPSTGFEPADCALRCEMDLRQSHVRNIRIQLLQMRRVIADASGARFSSRKRVAASRKVSPAGSKPLTIRGRPQTLRTT